MGFVSLSTLRQAAWAMSHDQASALATSRGSVIVGSHYSSADGGGIEYKECRTVEGLRFWIGY